MTAPGKNLDFQETDYYTAKVTPSVELANAIVEHLQSWPSSGEVICGTVRQFEFKRGNQTFAVVYSRHGQVIGLMNLFEMPTGRAALRLYLKEVLAVESSKKSSRRKS